MTSADQRAEQDRELRRRAEEFTLGGIRLTETPEAMAPEEARRMLHELRVHQIELEMQNEELRCAHRELEKTREEYFDLYDHAPVGYLTLHQNGLIQNANFTAAMLLGVGKNKLIKRRLAPFINPGDKDAFYTHRKRLFETCEPQLWEMRMVRADRTPFWAQIQATVVNAEQVELQCRVVLSDITASKQASEAVAALSHERGVLLKEVHHRVKNNLQLIVSMIRLEFGRRPNPETRMVLKDLQGRVMSLAIMHDTLTKSDNLGRIDFDVYIHKLTRQLFHSLVADSGSILLELDLVPTQLEMGQAISCGLLLSELISNCLNHGFPDGRTGKITIQLQRVAGGPQLRLRVSDDGVGLPADFEMKQKESLGMQLISDLTEQLHGRLEIIAGQAVAFEVTFTPTPDQPPFNG
jgi:PAS domain S-box-containing protein